MKYRQWLATIVAGLSLSVTANTDMSKSFNEAREVGKSNNSNAQSILRDFQPTKELDNFQSRPTESGYYQGITSNPDLSSKGMQSLNTSEVGKSIRESTINNPKVDISEDSDFIQNSNNIRKNAAAISGMTNSKQCVKQVLSKMNFTYHYCEKDQAINKVCHNTADVVWSGQRSLENREKRLTYNNGITVRIGRIRGGFIQSSDIYFDFELPENAVITGYDYHFVNNRGWFGLSKMTFSLFNHTNAVNGNSYNPVTVKVRNLNISVKSGDKFSAHLEHIWNYFGRDFDKFMTTTTQYIQLYYQVEVDNLKPEIVWKNSCGNFDDSNLIKIGEKCTQEGGTRNFFKDGKNVQLHSDCWQKQTEYLVSEASDNECRKYDDNPNCTAGERECILKLGGDCVRHRIKYQCSKTVKTDGYVCGDKFFCSDGTCSDLEGSLNSDFGHAVSQLATLAQAGKDVSLDEVNLRAFSGRPMFCRKSGFGFSDCCKDSGWGHKVGLAQCNSEENALGQAKEKKLTIFVGTYCDKEILGKCIRRKSSYCVFDNKLARIIQAQGRSGQLGLGFGSANSPDCRGLNVEELQRIDFNAMDYSDFYEELEANKQIPDKDQLIEYMRKSITNQLQQ